MPKKPKQPAGGAGASLNVQNPDRVLVVEVEGKIYAIPFSDLMNYWRSSYDAWTKDEIDAFFKSHPGLRATLVDTIHIFDGSS